MISVLILTKNEEKDLPGCLASVAWSDDVVVYDSYSEDRTVDVAEQSGARVVQREFDNWSSHQNWGLQNIAFKNEWVLYVDADERVSPELKKGVMEAISSLSADEVAFRVRRRDFWGETWLKHVQATSLYVRLFKPGSVRYERLVNPVTRVSGKIGEVTGYLDHYPFSKGVAHWVARHNSYSDMEAAQIESSELYSDRALLSLFFDAVRESEFSTRRSILKASFYRLPFRPVIRFSVLYFLKRGFLDGRAGLRYAFLQMFYEYLICLKQNELKLSRG